VHRRKIGRQCLSWVMSLGGDRGRGSVYVRSTSDRVESLCTAAKDANCQQRTNAVQQIWSLLDDLVGAREQLRRDIKLDRSRSLKVDHKLDWLTAEPADQRAWRLSGCARHRRQPDGRHP
jgi:hypothetical protein